MLAGLREKGAEAARDITDQGRVFSGDPPIYGWKLPGYEPASVARALVPLWALTGGRAGAAGHVPARAGSCRDWRQQEPAARPRRVRQAAV